MYVFRGNKGIPIYYQSMLIHKVPCIFNEFSDSLDLCNLGLILLHFS